MILLDDKNKSSETHLFSQSLFSGEDYSLASSTDLLFLIFCSLPYCEAVQLIDTSDKTNSQITSNCFTVCRGTVDSLLQTSSTIYSNSNNFWFRWNKLFSYFYIMCQSISSNKHLSFSFSSDLYISTRCFCLLTCFSLVQPWIFC